VGERQPPYTPSSVGDRIDGCGRPQRLERGVAGRPPLAVQGPDARAREEVVAHRGHPGQRWQIPPLRPFAPPQEQPPEPLHVVIGERRFELVPDHRLVGPPEPGEGGREDHEQGPRLHVSEVRQ
jgi:hypothetical protein